MASKQTTKFANDAMTRINNEIDRINKDKYLAGDRRAWGEQDGYVKAHKILKDLLNEIS